MQHWRRYVGKHDGGRGKDALAAPPLDPDLWTYVKPPATYRFGPYEVEDGDGCSHAWLKLEYEALWLGAHPSLTAAIRACVVAAETLTTLRDINAAGHDRGPGKGSIHG